MKRLFIVFLLVFFAIACSKNDQVDPDSVMLRVKNVSDFNFSEIIIKPGKQEHNYGDLKKGKYSEYESFSLAYRYTYIELKIDGKMYILQPIDYVGETPLSNGWYTYQVDASAEMETYGRLSLSLTKD